MNDRGESVEPADDPEGEFVMKKLVCAAVIAAGAMTALAAPASAETRMFSGSGVGTYPSDAVASGERTARSFARSAGWTDPQCYVHSWDVRPHGGYYSALVNLYCQR